MIAIIIFSFSIYFLTEIIFSADLNLFSGVISFGLSFAALPFLSIRMAFAADGVKIKVS